MLYKAIKTVNSVVSKAEHLKHTIWEKPLGRLYIDKTNIRKYVKLGWKTYSSPNYNFPKYFFSDEIPLQTGIKIKNISFTSTTYLSGVYVAFRCDEIGFLREYEDFDTTLSKGNYASLTRKMAWELVETINGNVYKKWYIYYIVYNMGIGNKIEFEPSYSLLESDDYNYCLDIEYCEV